MALGAVRFQLSIDCAVQHLYKQTWRARDIEREGAVEVARGCRQCTQKVYALNLCLHSRFCALDSWQNKTKHTQCITNKMVRVSIKCRIRYTLVADAMNYRDIELYIYKFDIY